MGYKPSIKMILITNNQTVGELCYKSCALLTKMSRVHNKQQNKVGEFSVTNREQSSQQHL